MGNNNDELIENLPGADMIREGIKDFIARRLTISSCLVRIASPRLSKAGLIPQPAESDINAELDLYEILSKEGKNAYSRYNALIRELVSFEHCLDQRLSKS